MIQLEGISKSFGKQEVLKNLDFKISPGQITVIIGPSGEGKSVLLKIIIGLLTPDSGKVVIGDRDLFSLSNVDQIQVRKKFGMLFQHAALFDSMNVEDNVAFPLREHTNLLEEEILNRVSQMLEQVGLSGVGDKWPSELSGGMRKRVGLARALILEPEIILYDEPTTGLDPLLTDSIDKLIVDTQKRFNLTSVIVSHDIRSALKIADKIAMLHGGNILEEGAPEKFKKSSDPFVQSFLIGKSENNFIG